MSIFSPLNYNPGESKSVAMSGFFEEVKRRKVYRVAVAYVIAAGGIIQLGSAAFPAWELPNWALRLVIVLLLVGFPITLILACAFDVTPQGIRATPNVATPRTNRRRNMIMLVATGVIVSAIAGFFLLPRISSARKIDKSIAVLPFENLSDEKENAYFADGIQDDVLTNLSKIGDLKVISRTSVMQYKGAAKNVREIGKALGVSNILEGSVRRSGNKVRVNVQLIDATSDKHTWANDYDRDLTDVFAIQSDLAEQALQLQPDLPEAHLAMGQSYYYGDNNYDAAQKEFEIAQRGLPNESEVYLSLGAIQRRQGRWAESTANFEKAASLNPKESWPLQNLAQNYQVLRDFDAANKTIDRGLKVDPSGLGLWETKSKLAIAETGDLSVSEKAFQVVKSMPMYDENKLRIAFGRADVFILERKYQEGLREAESLPDDVLHAVFEQHLSDKYYLIGFARKALQDDVGARAAFLKAKDLLEAQLKQSPDAPEMHIQLAKVLAYIGQKDAALAEGRRATELLPESKDAFGGPEIAAGVAEVHAVLGDNGRAIEILDGLLSRPSGVTVQGLKVNPIWDPLRNDPQFQALFDKYGGKA